MRKAILIASLPLLLAIFLVSVSDLSGQSRKRKKKDPNIDFTKRTESPCGVTQSLDEMLDEIKVEWRIAASNDESIYYYNTLKNSCQKGILKIWVKSVQKDTAKPLSYSMRRYETNCRTNQLRLMSVIEYTKTGNVIDSTTYSTPEWQDIIPDTVGESIWQAVCHKAL